MNYNKILTAFRLTVKSANAIEKIIIPGEARNCLFSHQLNNHLILQWHYFTSRIVKQRSLFVRHIDGTHQFEATVHSKRYSFIFVVERKSKRNNSAAGAMPMISSSFWRHQNSGFCSFHLLHWMEKRISDYNTSFIYLRCPLANKPKCQLSFKATAEPVTWHTKFINSLLKLLEGKFKGNRFDEYTVGYSPNCHQASWCNPNFRFIIFN